MIRCSLCNEADAAGIPIHGWQHYRPLWPTYRELMERAHYSYGCGPGAVELVRECGYWYPLAYLARCVQEGAEVYLDKAGRDAITAGAGA